MLIFITADGPLQMETFPVFMFASDWMDVTKKSCC